MSTRFTERGVALVDSVSLQLVLRSAQISDLAGVLIAKRLACLGYEGLSSSHLNFLGAMDCGVNFGSDIARRLGVSRQMVAKTVKHLCSLEYLEQQEGQGRQKEIHFTVRGENLMADARKVIATFDQSLLASISVEEMDTFLNNLNTISLALSDLESEG